MSDKTLTPTHETLQPGPISGDMLPYLQRLAELVPLLPDDKIREARLAVRGLFDCCEQVAFLEHAACIHMPEGTA